MYNMNYKEAAEYIINLSPRGILPGLSNMRRLCEELGNPQDKIKTVHIAGTNGKGSVGAYIGKIFECDGIRVGRYVSPAVENMREAILLNDEVITENDYAKCVGIVRSAAERIESEGFFPTRFETETAAAFVFFYMKGCDFALIECGMGGRLDATNVISKPSCAVITKISEDHTAFLGKSVAQIAEEKAGIIKSGSITVSAAQCAEAAAVIEKKCAEAGSELKTAKPAALIRAELDELEFSYENEVYTTTLSGVYQAQNAALAICAAQALKIGSKAIKDGIEKAKWAYRFEVIKKSPCIILDGAHNPDGAAALAETVKAHFKKSDITFIMGIFRDKEYERIASLTAPLCKRVYTVTPPSPRGLEAEVLAEAVKKYNKNTTASDIKTAVCRCTADNENFVVFGSLSILKQARDAVTMKKYHRIYEHPLYKAAAERIRIAEKERIFCRHGIEHSLDTARIAYITALEENLPYDKELIYATALLHDMGRYTSADGHHKAGAELARAVMPECGYGTDDTEAAANAILMHRSGSTDGLAELLYRADKLSRSCYACAAYDKCYWSSEKKNKRIEY